MKFYSKHRCFLLCLVLLSGQGFSQIVKLESPDRKIQVSIEPGKTSVSLARYTMKYNGKKVIDDGNIGFSMEGKNNAYSYAGSSKKSVSTSWQTVYGERKHVPDVYHETWLRYKGSNNQDVEIICRAYNEGFAFRYIISNKDSIIIDEEESTFPLPKETIAWASKWAQGPIEAKKINEIKETVERPLTVKLRKDIYLSLGEAALVDYARMKFAHSGDHTLKTDLDGKVRGLDTLRSPWRFIMAGKSPAELLQHNYLVLNLNEPNKISDTRWIKPGKVLREPTLTTEGSYRAIDFASAHGIQYIIFDAGWYGKEDADTSSATRVMIDPPRYKGPLDMHKVIDYGNQKNVGVILYVNRRALERQLDTLLPLFRAWGVKGIKFGFVNVGSQYWTSWVHEAVRKCADYQMLVDIHDEYRPTGYSRTYPNLLTQEGIRGDEESPFTEQSIKTLFTRMIAGAADNTICYFNNRVNKMSSHAAQMAKSVALYSPLQFLYWYDSPAPGKTSNFKEGDIQPVDDLKWFDSLKVVWDTTVVIEGSMEDYATIARRNVESWWIGSLNGQQQRTLKLPLKFLDKQRRYHATIYTDDSTLNTSTNVKIEKRIVDAGTILNFTIAPRHGVAIRITPVQEEISVRIDQTHNDWIYKTGEPVSFTISVIGDREKGEKIPVEVQVGEEKMPARMVKKELVGDGTITIDGGTMDNPGFLRCMVTTEWKGKKYRVLSTAAFSPEQLVPTVKMPADFEAFWDKNIEAMRSYPLDTRMRFLPESSSDSLHVFEVSFQGSVRGSRVYGILSRPAQPGNYPAILKVPGAGVRAYHGDTALANKGIITLEIGIHGVPVTMENQVYYDLASGGLRDYYFSNLQDRDAYYYKRVYLNCVRAMDFLASLQDVDTSRMGVYGGSQGGALSVVTAALDKRVKFLGCLYPALSDLTGYFHGRAGGWPHMFGPAAPTYLKDEEEINTAAYYDVVNFAKHINVPGWYAFGYNDEVCPPTTSYSVFNSVSAPKTLFLDKPSGHWMTSNEAAELKKVLVEFAKKQQ